MMSLTRSTPTSVLVATLVATFLSATFLASAAGAGASPARIAAAPARMPIPKDVLPPDPAPCIGSITDLLSPGGVDLRQRGFAFQQLGEGYDLMSYVVGNGWACGAPGPAANPALYVSTLWQASGDPPDMVSVSQMGPSTQPVANVLEFGWSSFSSGGYDYGVSIWGGWVAGGGSDGPSGAPESPETPVEKSFGAPRRGQLPAEMKAWAARLEKRLAPSAPPGAPAPGPAPRVAAKDVDGRLAEVIARLAPELDLACFYRRTEGGWEDFGPLGLGDPRPAFPGPLHDAAGELYLSFLEHPPAGCEGPVPVLGDSVALWAYFYDYAGSGASLAFGVSSVPEGGYPGYTGYLDDFSAYWADERYAYSVYVYAAGTDSSDVEAVAKALDPDFSSACFLRTRQLSPAEVTALGFHLPQAPAGYALTSVSLVAQTVSAACEDPPRPNVFLYWSFSDGSTNVDAQVWRYGPIAESPPDLAANPMTWIDAHDTYFQVWGYSYDGSIGPAQEILIEVARSLDPSFPR